jgi:hypothetical protein
MISTGQIQRHGKVEGSIETILPGDAFECSDDEAAGYLSRKSARLAPRADPAPAEAPVTAPTLAAKAGKKGSTAAPEVKDVPTVVTDGGDLL